MLLGGIASHAVAPNLYAKLPYNPFTDLETVAWIGTQPNMLCCHPSFPHDTVPKLIAAAKAEPGKYQYGSSGVGASPSLTMELLKQKTGADLTLISYRGASAAAADVLAGHVPLCIANIDSLMGQVSAGKLKPIATTGAKRSTVAPDTPTLVESIPDLVVTSWSIWAVPAGTPAKIKDKLKAATERALQDAEVIASMRQGGFEPGANCRRRGRCLHQGRAQALGRGDPCRGHQAGIGISSPTSWRRASTWCSAAPRPAPPRSRRAPTTPIPATPSGRPCMRSA